MSAAGSFADISSNNPIPNMAAYAAAGHTDLCRKVSEGIGYHWFEGDQVADDAHAHGLHVGHYHWLRPDASATAQAAYFVGALKGHVRDGDWLMTDFERTYENGHPVDDIGDEHRAQQLREFNAYVHDALPTVPLLVYTGNWYLDGKPACQAEIRKWPVVMSDYRDINELPNPYGLTYAAWQFTDHATVPGFDAPVDYNRWLHRPTPTAQEFTMTPAEAQQIQNMIDTSIAKALARGVNVNGLLDWGHTGYYSPEWFMSGVPGYRALSYRRPKSRRTGGSK